MADLIDREALLWEYKTNNKYSANAASLAQCIHDAPTVDAVPFVRCKDCIGKSTWYNDAEYGCAICGMSGMYPKGTFDFCSYGERRKK